MSLVDRRSKYVVLQKVESRKANEVKDCIIKCLRKMLKCYFATPYASWERDLNEHTNGLSRQYLPKKTEFIGMENDEILAIQKALNNRPGKVLNYRTPNEVMRGIEKPLGVALHG